MTPSALEPLTLTHARLRASQGDFRVAAAIAAKLLERDPGDAGARDLLVSVASRPDAASAPADEEALEAPQGAAPGELRARFRATFAGDPRARLRAWAEDVSRRRGNRRAT